jgi:hypothetical protein
MEFLNVEVDDRDSTSSKFIVDLDAAASAIFCLELGNGYQKPRITSCHQPPECR